VALAVVVLARSAYRTLVRRMIAAREEPGLLRRR
jgi:hypothetical protein